MSEPVDIPLDDDDRLYEPPLVDLLYREGVQGTYVITFVPADEVSDEPTEVVRVHRGAAEYQRIDSLFGGLSALVAEGKQIDRIVHQGGGNFAFHFDNGGSFEMSDAPSNSTTQEVSDRLKQIAEAAEAAFRIAHHVRR